MGWWLSVSEWIYFDLSFTGALFYHVFLTVSVKKKSLSQSFHVIALYYSCQDEDKRLLKVPHSQST